MDSSGIEGYGLVAGVGCNVGYFVDCKFSTLVGEDDRTYGPFRSHKFAASCGRAATGSYPDSHAGFVVRRVEYTTVDGHEADMQAARDGYDPNR